MERYRAQDSAVDQEDGEQDLGAAALEPSQLVAVCSREHGALASIVGRFDHWRLDVYAEFTTCSGVRGLVLACEQGVLFGH